MAKLTKTQIAFLEHHGIAIEDTFDANGLKRSDYRSMMKALDKSVAYGVTRCLAAGHSLRNRSGNCIQCRPEAIAYARRYREAGFVYIAQSKSEGVIKVGFSKDPQDRIYIARCEGYGGIWDWRLRRYVWTSRAGVVESALHTSLAPHQDSREWDRNGEILDTSEIYSCTLKTGIRHLKNLLHNDEILEIVR